MVKNALADPKNNPWQKLRWEWINTVSNITHKKFSQGFVQKNDTGIELNFKK